MRAATLTVHLPGVVLTDGVAALAGGQVDALSFDAWQRLDPAFESAERSFERSRPVFWTGPIEVDGNDHEAMLRSASHMMGRVHDAFLLDASVPWLPSPAMSAHYVRFEPLEPDAVYLASVLRVFGPFEREWMVFGNHVSYAYDGAKLSGVHRNWELLRGAGEAALHGPARMALATLERTTRPDGWWGATDAISVTDFLQCAAACESLLLGEEAKAGRSSAFARHAAALKADDEAEMRELRILWEDVYRLRSDLVHGRRGLGELDENRAALLRAPRLLLRDVAEALLRLARTGGPPPEPLPVMLARASAVPAQREAFRRLIDGDGD